VRRGLTILAFSAVLGVQGCASIQRNLDQAYRGDCAGGDARTWARLRERPSDAGAMRHQADENPVFPADNSYRSESWFVASDGDRMLCRTSSDSPQHSCVGAWWVFRAVDGRPQLSAKNGWLCVT
jgi:hypothetical protein